MGAKTNPLLAKFEAQLNAKYQAKLEACSEIDLITFMLTVHDELKVGPGRAKLIFDAFLMNRMGIIEAINDDWGDKDSGDKELLHTKATYAKLLKTIFSKEDWEEVKIFFPLLKEYW